MKNSCKGDRFLVGLAALAVVGAASAQVPDVLTVAFSVPAPLPVPVGTWVPAVLAVALGLAAFALIRTRGARRLFVLGCAGVVASAALVIPRVADAIPTFEQLVSSPTQIPLTCADQGKTFLFVDGLAQTATLTSVSVSGSIGFQIVGGTSCFVGTQLQNPGAGCYVQLNVPVACSPP